MRLLFAVVIVFAMTAQSVSAQDEPARCTCPMGFSMILSEDWLCACPKPEPMGDCALVCPAEGEIFDEENCACRQDSGGGELGLMSREDARDARDGARQDARDASRAAAERDRDRSFAYENTRDRDIVIVVRTPSGRDRAYGRMRPGEVRKFEARGGDIVIVKERETSGRVIEQFRIHDVD